MSSSRTWPNQVSHYVAGAAVELWNQTLQINANTAHVDPEKVRVKVKKLKELPAFIALKEELKEAWEKSVDQERKRRESPWQSTCLHGSLLKTTRMLVYIIIWLPILTLATELGTGAAVVVAAYLASYLQLADTKLHIFIIFSVVAFYCWCVFRGTKGKRKDVLGHAERIYDNNAVQVLMRLGVYRSNPYTKRITETEFLTVSSYKEYGFNTQLFWTLNLDEPMDFGRPKTFESQYKEFFFKVTKFDKNKNIHVRDSNYLIQISRGRQEDVAEETQDFEEAKKKKNALLCDCFDKKLATRLYNYYKFFDINPNNVFCDPTPVSEPHFKCARALNVRQVVKHLKNNSDICVLYLSSKIQVRG